MYLILQQKICVEQEKNWKVLGFIFDENLSWNVKVNEVIRLCFCQVVSTS